LRARAILSCALLTVLAASGLAAQERAEYRNFRLGSTTAAVAVLTGVPVPGPGATYQRPAVVQEMTWRPGFTFGRPLSEVDPVREIAFSFHDDHLFRIAVHYDQDRTSGMTDADLIEAVASLYGAPDRRVPVPSRSALSRPIFESDIAIARWGDGDTAATLYRSSYGTAFRLIVSSVSLEGRARAAEANARADDLREAPQREAARLKQAAEDQRDAVAKARASNKGTFRP